MSQPVRVELTYAMSKRLGVEHFDVEEARTVADVVAAARARFGDDAESFEQLTRLAHVAVNGVLVNYRKKFKTPLQPGDRVAFVKAAAGG
jgi:molybdopterin converting factor small subunit